MDFHTTIPYQSLNGSKASWSQVEQWARSLPLRSAVYFLSQMNESLANYATTANVRDDVLREHVVRCYRHKVAPLLAQGHVLFYPHQVLVAINLLLLWGSDEPPNSLRSLTSSEEQILAWLLLAVTDLLDGSPISCHADEVSYLLKRWPMVHAEPVPALLARWRYMLTEGPKKRRHFSPDPVFQAVTGYRASTYFDAGILLYLGFLTWTQKIVPRPLVPRPLNTAFFRNCRPVEAILRTISTDFQELRREVSRYTPQELLTLVKHVQLNPLVRLSNGEYFVLNFPRLGERVTAGAHYIVLAEFQGQSPANEATVRDYLGWLGYVFQDYVAELLDSIRAWRCYPELPNADPPMADATVCTATGEALLVECKTKRIRSKTFEGGRIDLYRQDLSGSNSVKGATKELSNRLSQIANGTYPISGLVTSDTLPMICTLEQTPAVLGLSREVDDVLHSYDWHGSPHPVVVGALDLELLVAAEERTGHAFDLLKGWARDARAQTLSDALINSDQGTWMGTWQQNQWEIAKLKSKLLLQRARCAKATIRVRGPGPWFGKRMRIKKRDQK